MPKVQTYGPRQVTQQVTRNQRLNQTRVADTSLDFQPLIAGISERKKRADETAAEQALINFERDKNKLFFDPDNGYFNKQGKDAYDGGEVTAEKLRQLQTQYADQFDSMEARNAFNRAAGVHVSRGLVDIDRHSFKGLEAYEISTMEARVENAAESAALYWNNDEEANIQRAVGRSTIIESYKRQGLSAEATNEAVQTFESKFQAGRIEAALNNDLNTANALFEKYGSRLEGPDRTKVEADLNKANYDNDVATATATIMGGGPQTLGDVAAMVEQMPSETPEQIRLKSEVLRQAKSQFTLWKQIEDERKEQLYNDLGKQVLNGQIQSRDISGSQWSQLTLKQQESIRRIEEEVLKGRPIKTDQAYYTEVMTMSDDQLLKVDLVDASRKLSESDYKKLITKVDGAKNPSGGDKLVIDDLTTDAQRLKALSNQIFGRDPAKLRREEARQYSALSQVVQNRIDQEGEAKGRKLSPSEKNAIFEEFKTEYVIEGGGRFFGDRTYALDDFSGDAIRYSSQILSSQGIPVNSVNILKFLSDDNNRKALAEEFGLDYGDL